MTLTRKETKVTNELNKIQKSKHSKHSKTGNVKFFFSVFFKSEASTH